MKFNFDINISISFLFIFKNVVFDYLPNQVIFWGLRWHPKVQLKLLMRGGWIFFQKQKLCFLYEVKFSKLYLNYFYVILIFTSVCKGSSINDVTHFWHFFRPPPPPSHGMSHLMLDPPLPPLSHHENIFLRRTEKIQIWVST